MYKRILLPLDGSNLAEQAIPHAVAQAKCFQAELILLKVLEFFPKERHLSGDLVSETFDLATSLARQYLEWVATQLKPQDISVSVMTAEGRPHVQIIQFAETNQVDLIVISTRGQSGLSRWLMGSVADRVVRGAGIPVLIIHAHDEEKP